MKKANFFGFVLSVAMAVAASQAVARIGDPPKQQPAPTKKVDAPAQKKSESGSKGSFGMASSGGNSRSDLAAQVKAREAAQQQAQQAAAKRAQEDAARASQQQQILAQKQAEQARAQQQAAEQARLAAIRSQQQAQQTATLNAQREAQREAQRLAEQNEAQARLIRDQQRAIAAQQDALRYRNNPQYGGYNGGYVSAEEAARRARNGAVAGAAVGGVVGYEVGKHSAEGNVQVQPGQVYQQAQTAPVAPAPVTAPVQTAPYVPAASPEKSSGSGFGVFLFIILLIGGGVAVYFFVNNKKKAVSKNSYAPETADSFAAKQSPEVVNTVAEPDVQVYDNRPVQDAALIQDVTEFFGKLQSYYNTKNAEALTALTSSQMLTSIKEAFVTGGHVVTEFSNVYVSLEEVKDTEVSALIEADAREVIDGEVSQYRLREIWTMKREAFGLVLDGITRLD